MAELFVPLTPGPMPGDGTSFRLKLTPRDAAPPAFTPRSTTALPASACPAPQPIVTVQREGDRVTGIRVQCTCGQVIELALTV